MAQLIDLSPHIERFGSSSLISKEESLGNNNNSPSSLLRNRHRQQSLSLSKNNNETNDFSTTPLKGVQQQVTSLILSFDIIQLSQRLIFESYLICCKTA